MARAAEPDHNANKPVEERHKGETPPRAVPEHELTSDEQLLRSIPERDPSVRLTSEEQLERSREIEKVGVAAWVEAHDMRDLADRPQRVAGVEAPKEQHK